MSRKIEDIDDLLNEIGPPRQVWGLSPQGKAEWAAGELQRLASALQRVSPHAGQGVQTRSLASSPPATPAPASARAAEADTGEPIGPATVPVPDRAFAV